MITRMIMRMIRHGVWLVVLLVLCCGFFLKAAHAH
jgi:hypothetical protein